jgi:C4-dicarboxylate-specific signal transduction histidine kinase
VDPHIPEVEVDAIQIQHLLLNVLRNASASSTSRSEAPSTVTVRSRAHDDCLVIEVEDNGACVRDPEKVFEPFYNNNHGELRMGLAISRSIAFSHGGTLVAERRQPVGMRLALHCRSGTPRNPLPKLHSVLFCRSSKLGPIHKHVMDSKRCLTYDREHADL